MTDLQINIELAQALGWILSEKFTPMHDQYDVFRGKVFCNKDGVLRKFDYRDPFIFVAICKHWDLFLVNKEPVSHAAIFFKYPRVHLEKLDVSIEKAAALCVIDAAKRGVK